MATTEREQQVPRLDESDFLSDEIPKSNEWNIEMAYQDALEQKREYWYHYRQITQNVYWVQEAGKIHRYQFYKPPIWE